MKLSSFLTSALVALALTTSGAFAAEKIKVGFVYVGPVGDGGWTYEHDQGRKAVEAEFGDMVETVYVESVPEDDRRAAGRGDECYSQGKFTSYRIKA